MASSKSLYANGIITPNPLKQGLKLIGQDYGNDNYGNYYPKSTKTRIETVLEGQ